MKTLKLIKDDCCENEIRESDIVEDLDFILNMTIIREEGEFADKAICLHNQFDYIVGKDSTGQKILVTLKRDSCCK